MINIDHTIRSFVGSKMRLVGVKILKEAPTDTEDKPVKPLRYSQLIRDAAHGENFTVMEKDISDANPQLALGFYEPKYLDIQPRISPAETKAVRIGPIEGADVILMILTPKQVMELAQVYGPINAKFQGELGVEGEATALPYMTGKPNVSFLCNSARLLAGYKDSEVILSMPYAKALALAEKIEEKARHGGALCGCLVSDIPPHIQAAFKDRGFEKGSDYFFGKSGDFNVRIYLDKDETGRFKSMTVHVPIKGQAEAEPPFTVKPRGNWSDVVGIFNPDEIGVNLQTGEGLIDTLKKLLKNIKN
ncbi:MAG: DUF169 domain-containing protein [Candidatus Altiarchaeota archaeon]